MGTTERLVLTCTAIGLAGAATIVTVAWRRASAWRALLAGAVVVSGLAVVALVIELTHPLSAFAVLHLVYLLGVLAVPLVGLGCLVAWGRLRPAGGLAVVALVLLVPGPIGAYATQVAPFRLREDRSTLHVAHGRAPEGGLRVGVLADLQLVEVSGHESRAVDGLMAQRPDLILIAGDLFQGDVAQLGEQLPAYRALLRRLHAPGGVYVVRGDCDDPKGWRDADIEQIVAGTGVRLLDDEVAHVEVRGQAVAVGGLQLDWRAPSARAVVRALEASPDDVLTIQLSHRPDSVLDLTSNDRIDLTVAGHTHGGQIGLPGIGPLVTLSDVPRDVAAGGLSVVDGNPIYVSSGVGLERGGAPQVRFLTRPSYGIVDLTARRAS